jgi:hypothetical protein
VRFFPSLDRVVVKGWSLERGVAFCFAYHENDEGIRMRGGRGWALLVVVLVAVLAGGGLGLWYGWVVNPVEYKDTDVAHLYAVYRDEYILMVAEAYALDGDLGTARARLALLSLPDPASAVADLAETAIAMGSSRLDIQSLARLAAVLGAQRDVLNPYLGASTGAADGQP